MSMLENLCGRGVLLDTNVWLDYCFPTRSGHGASLKLIDACTRAEIPLLITASSLKDIFYQVERGFRRAIAAEGGANNGISSKMAWGMLDVICQLAVAVGCDQSDVWLAGKLRSIHGDFEDDLVLAAMERSGAVHLVTNDMRLAANAPVSALSCEAALSLVSALLD